MRAMVSCYVEWVLTSQDLARFIFQARTLVSRKALQSEQLLQKNKGKPARRAGLFKPLAERGDASCHRVVLGADCRPAQNITAFG